MQRLPLFEALLRRRPRLRFWGGFLLLLSSRTITTRTVAAFQFTHEGWRIAMNIGREAGTTMPNDWAASGCRLPIVVQCDFRQEADDEDDAENDPKTKNVVLPLTGTIKFTGPDGEVVKPVERGEWSLLNRRELKFTLAFPEQLVRRDVTVAAGTTVYLEGLVYAIEDLQQLDQDYYQAREERWEAGAVLNEVARRKTAPKKWNFTTEQWEARYNDDDVTNRFTQLGQQFDLFRAERKERTITVDRPNPKDLSLECGPFPGITTTTVPVGGSTITENDQGVDGEVYFRKEGKVFLKQQRGFFTQDCLIGTWSAEPINDKPLSYY